MKNTFVLLTLLALMALSVAAQKAPVKKAAPKPSCADAPNQNEMNRCAYEEYQKADAELNKVYRQLQPKLVAGHDEKLKAAQRAWLAFRDAHCECESFAFEGGSMQPFLRSSCLEQATRDRTKQLQAMLKELISR